MPTIALKHCGAGIEVIKQIREKIRTGNYELTRHAEEEREEDNLEVVDLESAIINGKIVKKLTHDPRGTRYVLRGCATDERIVRVVCRILASGKLRIVTSYVEERGEGNDF